MLERLQMFKIHLGHRLTSSLVTTDIYIYIYILELYIYIYIILEF